jgi:putative ABC transport system permease protein
VIIVPDAVIDAAGDKALVAEMMFTADYNTKLDLTEEEMEKPIKTGLFNRRYDDTGVFLRGMILGTKREIYISSIGFGAMATFLALYLGIVFLITSAVILALKALSDSLDSLDRYDMLRRLGADEKDINGSLLRQQGIFFLLPMILAIFHSIFGIRFINKTLVIFGEYHILGSIVFTALIIGLIYGGYFLITYTCSRQIIKGRK